MSLSMASKRDEELIEADVEIFKYTHSELGYLACMHWGLPDDIACAVRRHHDTLGDAIKPGSLEANILYIEIADRLDVMILENRELDGLSPEELAAEIDQKCLWSAAVRKLIKADALAKRLDKIKAQCAQLIGGSGLT